MGTEGQKSHFHSSYQDYSFSSCTRAHHPASLLRSPFSLALSFSLAVSLCTSRSLSLSHHHSQSGHGTVSCSFFFFVSLLWFSRFSILRFHNSVLGLFCLSVLLSAPPSNTSLLTSIIVSVLNCLYLYLSFRYLLPLLRSPSLTLHTRG